MPIDAFNNLIENYDRTNDKINLKYNHSFSVMDLMGELAFRLNLDKEKVELARLIGLLHDIGGFEQVKKFDDFSDRKTEYDHAEKAADYLFKDGHIRDFIENPEYDNIIEKAIRNHNKYKIEEGLTEDELLFSKMIRDMDKVDTFKQIAINYERYFNANDVSKKVLECFKKEVLVDKKDVKSSTDFTLTVLAFIFDFNFNETYDMLVETDNFDLYLSVVDVNEDSEKLWKKIKEICFDKINRGIKE